MKLNLWEAPVCILSHHVTSVHNCLISKSSLAFYFLFICICFGLGFFLKLLLLLLFCEQENKFYARK